MYEKNINLLEPKLSESRLSEPRLSETESILTAMAKEERYELIAQAVQGLKELDQLPGEEVRQLWDSNDIELNFVEFVSHYS